MALFALLAAAGIASNAHAFEAESEAADIVSGTFSALVFNVAGLPAIISSGHHAQFPTAASDRASIVRCLQDSPGFGPVSVIWEAVEVQVEAS